MSAPSSRSRTFPDDGRPQAWQVRQVRPPYRREELEGTLEPIAVADGALLLHAADTITIVRVRGLRPFASTSWLTRVVGGGVSGPMVLEVLSLFPAGDREGEIAFSPQFLPPSLPPSLPRSLHGTRPWSSLRIWAAAWRGVGFGWSRSVA
jgi:hypothetical protein